MAPRRNAKTGQENKESVNHPWTASPKEADANLLYVPPPQKKTGRKGPEVIRRSLSSNAIPLQALTGPEGSSRLRPPDFKTIGT